MSRTANTPPSRKTHPTRDPAGVWPLPGGCACGQVRFQLERPPMFVHCCHCTRCQRETGGPFAHHAMVEFTAMSLLGGEPQFVKVPTDSGNTHWVARCPSCHTAMWNEHGSRQAITRYVRVGTLDHPAQLPPLAHIYVRSRQPWLALGDTIPAFDQYYDAARLWPAESLARHAAAKAAKAAKVPKASPTAKPARPPKTGAS